MIKNIKSDHQLPNMRIKSKNAVSEVVGTLAMLTITILIFSILFLWVQSIPTPQDTTHADLSAKAEFDLTGAYINITHNGGEILKGDIDIIIGDENFVSKYTFKIKDGLGKDEWKIGEVWSKKVIGLTTNDTISVSIVNNNAEETLMNGIVYNSKGGSTTNNLIIYYAVISNSNLTIGDNFTITVYLQYSDGTVPTNATVKANLSQLNLGIKNLTYSNGNYVLQTQTVPSNVSAGTKTITISATHNTNIATISLNVDVS